MELSALVGAVGDDRQWSHTVRLKSFELVIDVGCGPDQGNLRESHYETISLFLNAFQGLEDLYLMLACYVNWETIAESILGHTSTLDRLILHERNEMADVEWVASMKHYHTQSRPKREFDVLWDMPQIS